MSHPTILITGANRGIGLELATQFAADGWQVIACCRNPAAADTLQTLAEANDAVEIHALEVTDYARMAALSVELGDRPIDVLLSNAGIYGPRGVVLGEVSADDWWTVLEVNTIAPLMLAQAFVEQVAASERKLIAVISSKMGSIADNGSGGSYFYRSSKTAVNQVFKCLSIDLAGQGISVICLHPGWVKTDMGGANAETGVDDSAAGLKAILQSAGAAQNGHFLNFDGSEIPW